MCLSALTDQRSALQYSLPRTSDRCCPIQFRWWSSESPKTESAWTFHGWPRLWHSGRHSNPRWNGWINKAYSPRRRPALFSKYV